MKMPTLVFQSRLVPRRWDGQRVPWRSVECPSAKHDSILVIRPEIGHHPDDLMQAASDLSTALEQTVVVVPSYCELIDVVFTPLEQEQTHNWGDTLDPDEEPPLRTEAEQAKGIAGEPAIEVTRDEPKQEGDGH